MQDTIHGLVTIDCETEGLFFICCMVSLSARRMDSTFLSKGEEYAPFPGAIEMHSDKKSDIKGEEATISSDNPNPRAE